VCNVFRLFFAARLSVFSKEKRKKTKNFKKNPNRQYLHKIKKYQKFAKLRKDLFNFKINNSFSS